MFKDAFGREIDTGDYVIYGKSFGRCAGLGVGRVLAIRETMEEKLISREPWEYGMVPSGRFVLDVMTLQGWHPIKEPNRCTKTTLQFEERVLIVSPSEVPEVQRGILDKAFNLWMECSQ
jgi:hypothetical protein